MPPDSAISWAHYLRFGDRVYTVGPAADPAVVVGERLGTVTCTRSNSRTPVNHLIRDGEAAYLEAGTEFHAVAGRSPEEVITAVFNGQRLLFAPDAMLTAQLGEAQPPASDVLDVGPNATAATVKAETIVDLPDTNCKQVGEEGVRRLAGALDGAAPYGVGEPCRKGEGRVYKVVLDQPGVPTREFVVPTPCGPLTEGSRRYRVSEDLSNVLIREHDKA